MIERRKFIRTPHQAGINYEVSNSPKSYSSVIRNISQNGVCFFTKHFIPVDTILKLRFSLLKYSYDGFAKVVWISQMEDNRYEVGAVFINEPKVS